MRLCGNLAVAMWVRTVLNAGILLCQHPLQYINTYTHIHATYLDKSVSSVADHSAAPLEALLRAIVAIYGIKSQQACRRVLYSM